MDAACYTSQHEAPAHTTERYVVSQVTLLGA